MVLIPTHLFIGDVVLFPNKPIIQIGNPAARTKHTADFMNDVLLASISVIQLKERCNATPSTDRLVMRFPESDRPAERPPQGLLEL